MFARTALRPSNYNVRDMLMNVRMNLLMHHWVVRSFDLDCVRRLGDDPRAVHAEP